MSIRAQDILVDVLLGEVPGVCIDVEEVREAPSLQCAWDGAFDYRLPPRLWWWFIGTFVDDPEEFARIRRGADAIRGVFLDIAKLHYAQTGEATPLPERLIRALEMEVIRAMRPSPYEVATGATGHVAARASRSLAGLTREIQWRTRS